MDDKAKQLYESLNSLYLDCANQDVAPSLVYWTDTDFIAKFGQEEFDRGIQQGYIIQLEGHAIRISSNSTDSNPNP